MQNKPVVQYLPLYGQKPKAGSTMRIIAFEHPRLGTSVVQTGTIQEVGSDGCFETGNTHYKLKCKDNGTEYTSLEVVQYILEHLDTIHGV